MRRDGAQPRVLIIGDAAAGAEGLAGCDRLGRFRLARAPCSEDAAAAIKADCPEIVLLDLQVFDAGGSRILRAIRKLQNLIELPVIVLTAPSDDQSLLEAIACGANDVLTKPIDVQLLLARIAVQLNIRAECKRAIAEQTRLQRRLETSARLDALGCGDSESRNFLMNELYRGMAEGHVQLVYQPQYRVRPGIIDAAEALMRWSSPTLGHVPPDRFIKLAEETGDIAAVTKWVVARAMADHARLAAAGHDIRLAVNLSAILASDDAFVDQLIDVLSANPSAISLELTESAIFESPEAAIANLHRFANAGVRIAIDDYGTGMSSLSYIQRLPVHELKIDRMFVSKLTSSHRDPLLVRSTIELAHALEFEVVAEGVEDAQTLALLSVMGADLAQGYFISPPMAIDDLTSFLDDRERHAALAAAFDAKAFLRDALEGGARTHG